MKDNVSACAPELYKPRERESVLRENTTDLCFSVHVNISWAVKRDCQWKRQKNLDVMKHVLQLCYDLNITIVIKHYITIVRGLNLFMVPCQLQQTMLYDLSMFYLNIALRLSSLDLKILLALIRHCLRCCHGDSGFDKGLQFYSWEPAGPMQMAFPVLKKT